MKEVKSPEQNLKDYIRARRPIIYINDFDFEAVDVMIDSVAKSFKGGCCLTEYSLAGGELNFYTKVPKTNTALPSDTTNDPVANLGDFLQKNNTSFFSTEEKQKIVVLREVHEALRDKRVYSALQMIAYRKSKAQDKSGDYYRLTFIIVDSCLMEIPAELNPFITCMEMDCPDDEDVKCILNEEAHKQGGSVEDLPELTMALHGLSKFEIVQIVNLALMKYGGVITQEALNLIFEEKRQAIKKSGGLLEMVDVANKPDPCDFDRFISYIDKKAYIFKNLVDAKNYGLEPPSGVLLVGMPGCGKSLAAACVAKKFDCPLLKLDIGRMLGPYLGNSEENFRRALKVAEKASPCVLWIDEMEKAFGGAKDEGKEMTRIFGYFLTWLQEKTSPVYVFATANDISNLPPEFTRCGRFDGIFKALLPKNNGISAIFEAHLRRRRTKNIDLDYLKSLCENENKNFSGADIEGIVKSAAECAYFDGRRSITNWDLSTQIKEKISSYEADKAKYEKLEAQLKKVNAIPVSKNIGD